MTNAKGNVGYWKLHGGGELGKAYRAARDRAMAILKREGYTYRELEQIVGLGHHTIFDAMHRLGVTAKMGPRDWHKGICRIRYRWPRAKDVRVRARNIKCLTKRDTVLGMGIVVDGREVFLTQFYQVDGVEVMYTVQMHMDRSDWDCRYTEQPAPPRRHTLFCGWLGDRAIVSYGRFSRTVGGHLAWLCPCLDGAAKTESVSADALRLHARRSSEPAVGAPEGTACTLAGLVDDDLAFAEMMEVNRRRAAAEAKRLGIPLGRGWSE